MARGSHSRVSAVGLAWAGLPCADLRPFSAPFLWDKCEKRFVRLAHTSVVCALSLQTQFGVVRFDVIHGTAILWLDPVFLSLDLLSVVFNAVLYFLEGMAAPIFMDVSEAQESSALAMEPALKGFLRSTDVHEKVFMGFRCQQILHRSLFFVALFVVCFQGHLHRSFRRGRQQRLHSEERDGQEHQRVA